MLSHRRVAANAPSSSCGCRRRCDSVHHGTAREGKEDDWTGAACSLSAESPDGASGAALDAHHGVVLQLCAAPPPPSPLSYRLRASTSSLLESPIALGPRSGRSASAVCSSRSAAAAFLASSVRRVSRRSLSPQQMGRMGWMHSACRLKAAPCSSIPADRLTASRSIGSHSAAAAAAVLASSPPPSVSLARVPLWECLRPLV